MLTEIGVTVEDGPPNMFIARMPDGRGLPIRCIDAHSLEYLSQICSSLGIQEKLNEIAARLQQGAEPVSGVKA
jgi:hypothetical protein